MATVFGPAEFKLMNYGARLAEESQEEARPVIYFFAEGLRDERRRAAGSRCAEEKGNNVNSFARDGQENRVSS